MQIFQKDRIRVQELIQDTVNFVTDQFKQSSLLFTAASSYGQIIFVIQQITQLILYYIEDSITELNINSATRQNSIYGLASLSGHSPTRSISSIGEISLYWNGTESDVPGGIIIIPKNTRLKFESNNSLEYLIDIPDEDIRLPLETGRKIIVNILQGRLESQFFTGTGEPLQSFEVNFKKNVQIEQFNVNVYVNGEIWQVYDSFYDIPKNKKGCIIKTGITSGIDIFFGNRFFGAMPALGSEIRIEYLVSDGSRGNSDIPIEESFFSWSDTGFSIFGDELDLNELISIDLIIPPDFGSNPEPIELTRLIAPKTSKNFVFANADNYIIFLEKFNFFSIVDAYSTFDDDFLDDDNVIYLFLVPDIAKRLRTNENYFTIDSSKFILNDFQKTQILNLIEKSGGKIVTTEVIIVDPTIQRYIININISIFERYNPDSIKQKIVNRISDYFLSIRRRDKIPRSDLIAILEGIDGIDSVSLNFISESDELLKRNDPSASSTKIDVFGDIIIGRDELPIIRGGWQDRNGFEYKEGLDLTNPSSINIDIRSIVPFSHNSEINNRNKNNLRNNNSDTIKPLDINQSSNNINL